jgi:hypothetical protein
MKPIYRKILSISILLVALTAGISAKKPANVPADLLNRADYKHYIDYFNRMEDENIVQAIPNDSAWGWLNANIPFFDCPQDNFVEMYYFRWWTYRKHLKETPAGYVFTEFLVNRNYADKYNMIACAIGHHIYEGRWLKDQKYLDQYLHVWYRGNEGKPMNKLHKFSSWTADAVYNRFLVEGDTAYVLNFLPDLEQDYASWESTNRLPNGLYWQGDVQDGMEESLSGGRKIQNARPTINSYMYGNAVALSKLEALAGDKKKASFYSDKATELKNLVQTKLWNADQSFFETRWVNDSLCNIREAIGYLPWYFNLPDKGYEEAWKQVMDPQGFLAPYGLTTAERRHPAFRTHGVGKCEWDGAVWPFATSQTLTAMANLLNNYDQQYVRDTSYYKLFETYVESQYKRGRPYVGEYLDEVTGYWLKGDQERSRYYNHSTFNDLLITGLIGLRPRSDNMLVINPQVPANKWDWFCLDRVPYHGRMITIQWDKTGLKYGRGKGFQIYVNGKLAASAATLGRIRVELK